MQFLDKNLKANKNRMDLQIFALVLPSIVTLTITIGIGIYTWGHKSIPGVKIFLVLNLLVFEWVVADGFQNGALSLETKILWLKIKLLGIIFLPVVWLLFILIYTDRRQALNSLNLFIILTIPTITWGAALTNERHGLIWREAFLTRTGTVSILNLVYGWGLILYSIFGYFLIIIGSYFLIRKAFHERSLYRGQSITFLLGTLFPSLGIAITLSNLNLFLGVDLIPIGFALGGIIIGFGIMKYRFLDIFPLARSTVIENAQEGFLVLDTHFRLVDVNPVGLELLKISKIKNLGQSIEKIFPTQQHLFDDNRIPFTEQITIGSFETKQHFEITTIPLENKTGRGIGYLITIRNITLDKETKEALKSTQQNLERLVEERTQELQEVNEELNIEIRKREEIEQAHKETTARLKMLHEIDQSILAEQPIDMIASLALGHLQHLTPCLWASVLIFDLEKGMARALATFETGKTKRNFSEGIPIEEFGDISDLQEGNFRDITTIQQTTNLTLLDERMTSKGVANYLIIPMITWEEFFGTLMLGAAEVNSISSDHILIAREAAAQLAVAIRQFRLMKKVNNQTQELTHHISVRTAELDKALRRQAALAEIELTINQAQELDELLNQITETIMLLLPASSGTCLVLWDDEKKEFFIQSLAKLGQPPQTLEKRIPAHEGITNRIIQTKEPLIVDDVTKTPYEDTGLLEGFEYKAFMGAPIMVKEKVLGVLYAIDREPRQYTQGDENFLMSLAYRAATAIIKVQLLESEKNQRAFAETLNAANLALTKNLKLEDVLNTLLEYIGKQVPYDGANVLLLENNTHATVSAVQGYQEWTDPDILLSNQFEVNAFPSFRLIQKTKKTIMVPDTSQDPSWSPLPGAEKVKSWLGVPLIARGELIGFYSLDKLAPNFFTKEHIYFAESLAAQAALAIQNARLYESTIRTAEEMKAARDILHRLNSTSAVKDAFSEVIAGLKSISRCESVSLAFIDEDKNYYKLAAVDKSHLDLSKGPSFPINQSAAARHILAGQIHLTPDLAAEVDFPMEKALLDLGFKSRMNIPLSTGKNVFGALNLAWSEKKGYQSCNHSLLIQIAEAFALAIEKYRLFEKTQEALAETNILYRAARSLIGTGNLNDLLNTVVNSVVDALQADRVFLLTFDHEEQEIGHFIKGGPGADELEKPSFEDLTGGLSGSVLREREPTFSPKGIRDSRESSPLQQQHDESEFGAVIVVPLKYRNDIFGTLTAINQIDQQDFTQRDVDLMMTLANQAVIAIENARLFDEVQRLAITDVLTGIHNRRHFFELAEQSLKTAQQNDDPLTAIMLDIDHFKKINDTYGHTIGDQVLRALAKRCQNSLRENDILGRYGGEEFAIILPDTNLEAAISIADRIRLHIVEYPINTKRGSIPASVSLGVAKYDDSIPDLLTLLDHADAALYDAKQSGRNRVSTSQNQLQEGNLRDSIRRESNHDQ